MGEYKKVVVLVSTLIFYILWAIFVGIRSRKLRAGYRADFKRKAEENGCCVQARLVKTKKRYQRTMNTGDDGQDFREYDKSIYEYTAKGKKYRFSRCFNYCKSPYTITVWYQKNHPRKRVIGCDDVFRKYGCLIAFVPPILFGGALYGLLTVVERLIQGAA